MEKVETSAIVHFVYDKKTGSIVHKHTSFNVEKNIYTECKPAEVIDIIKTDSLTMNRVTDQNPKNLDVLIVKDAPAASCNDLIVDVKNKKLLNRPRIRLSTDKRELAGDGNDSTVIKVEVVDHADKLMKDYSGTIKITTSRGKLSVKKGLVTLKEGRGEVLLTSTKDTVSRVKINAQCVKHACSRSNLEIEFA